MTAGLSARLADAVSAFVDSVRSLSAVAYCQRSHAVRLIYQRLTAIVLLTIMVVQIFRCLFLVNDGVADIILVLHENL